jgi:hypothetical protein
MQVAGPEVMPGTYSVSVTVDGRTETASARVIADPNQPSAPAAQERLLELALQARAQLDAMNGMLNRISAMQSQLATYRKTVETEANGSPSQPALAKRQAPLLARAEALDKELGKLKSSIYNPNVQHKVMEDSLHHLLDLHGALKLNASTLANRVQAPTAPLLAVQTELTSELTAKLSAYNGLLSGDVAAYDKAARAAGAPMLAAGKQITLAEPPQIH